MAAPVEIAPAAAWPPRIPGSGVRPLRTTREKGDHLKDAGTNDLIAGIFGVIALAASIVQFFYVPFAFAPAALLALAIAIISSPKYRGLYELTAVVLVVGFVVGASVAVIADNPLY